MKMSRASWEKPLMYAVRLWAMLFGSPFSFSKSNFETLWNGTPVTRFRMGSRFWTLATLQPVRTSSETFALGVSEDAVETAQDRHRQDDLPVVGLLVVTAQKVSDGPEEVREVAEPA